MQKLAHEIALEAVKTMKHGRVRIIIDGSEIREVETSKRTIKFYAKHVSYAKHSERDHYGDGYWGFEFEEKPYSTSNHCSKISFWSSEETLEKNRKAIVAFIDKMMAGVKPVPRFSLSKLAA